MDGTTEPILAVVGHPIAGNPSQFALERALQSIQLDWRVLSLDVKPKDLSKAIEGAWVMGLRGMLLDARGASALQIHREDDRASDEDQRREDETEETEATIETDDDSQGPSARHRKTEIAAPPTCFYRDPDFGSGFRFENAESKWLEEVIRRHCRNDDNAVGPVLSIGRTDPRFPASMVDIDSQTPIAWAATESIEQAGLIVISEHVDVATWPSDNGSTLVIDLTLSTNSSSLDSVTSEIDHTKLTQLGYATVTADEIRAAQLSQSLMRWTGTRPALEVLQEAIEEYWAV